MRILIICTILVAPLAVLAQAGGEDAEIPKDEHSIFLSGDSILTWSVNASVFENGSEYIYKDISALVRGADVAMTNLEGVVSLEGDLFPKERKPYLFRSHPVTINALVDGGFDVVTTANNHSMDYGRAALRNEFVLLRQANIGLVGSGNNVEEARRPLYVQVGDKIVAFINYYNALKRTAATPKKAGLFHVGRDFESVKKVLEPVVKEAKRHANLVIVSPHWGSNWRKAPNEAQRKLARSIIDWGADAFFGHHAHQLQGMEIYKGKPIVYDMGNLISDGAFVKGRAQAMGYLLHFNGEGLIRLDAHSFELTDEKVGTAGEKLAKRSLRKLEQLSKALNSEIEFKKVGDHLEVLLAPLKEKPDAELKRPEEVFVPNRTTHLPVSLTDTAPNIVSRSLPGWNKDWPRVPLRNIGLEIVDAKVPQLAHRKYGFVARVALKVKGELKESWKSHIRIVSRKTGREQLLARPVLNGEWPVKFWKVGDVVQDTFLMRLGKTDSGTHDVYWGMSDPRGLAVLPQQHKATDGPKPGDIKIGEIEFVESVQKNIAGLHWDGRRSEPAIPEKVPLSENTEKQQLKDGGQKQYLFIAAGAAFAILGAVLGVVVRRRREKKN